ncbi:IS66 family insertion sequence element accessory protein TnpB [Blastopirellula sp. J2-11]|uniref:IS66 family insertion sequence element accessory protein TnpB n=1 Tax=Blastopirellula sp. J2-11 TaxID=2943192 RepID=UPI0021C99379|nr:IS66 family insertion sequence element accessory protein TnpB [Blastopirellula sp. J2-11]UUO06179.1 IS66 family insertion sequence element accessory protein TnpB [Blastopirellula sp. J2-11]
MLSVPGSLKIFVATAAVDFRKSHDGLAAIVEQAISEDLFGGGLFVFTNKRCDRLKILYWDSDGLALWYKRLEAGTFRLPRAANEASRLEISAADLSLILSGVELSSVKRRKRYRRSEADKNSPEKLPVA